MFSLRKRNTAVPTTGKAGTETAASLATTIPNYQSTRQARHTQNPENTVAIRHSEVHCNLEG